MLLRWTEPLQDGPLHRFLQGLEAGDGGGDSIPVQSFKSVDKQWPGAYSDHGTITRITVYTSTTNLERIDKTRETNSLVECVYIIHSAI